VSDWPKATLGEVADLLIGPAFKSSVFREATEGPRLLRGINVGPDGTRWDETFLWPSDQHEEFSKYDLAVGDVVIAMDATFTRSGHIRAAVVREDDLPALLVQRVARLRQHSERLVDGWIPLVVQSSGFRAHLSNRQTGAYAPHISGKDIAGYVMPVPTLAEQGRIVDVVSGFDAHIAALEAEAVAARALDCTLVG
jgi:type I restriction enzyme S subunit